MHQQSCHCTYSIYTEHAHTQHMEHQTGIGAVATAKTNNVTFYLVSFSTLYGLCLPFPLPFLTHSSLHGIEYPVYAIKIPTIYLFIPKICVLKQPSASLWLRYGYGYGSFFRIILCTNGTNNDYKKAEQSRLNERKI